MIAIQKIWMDTSQRLEGTEEMPDFGWVLESDGRNVRQKAYRLQISLDPSFSNAVFDSGKVESDESAHVRPEGVNLRSCATYHVRAKVWTEKEESDWAQTRFVTALIDQPWQAKFISAETIDDWNNSKGTYLRKEWKIVKPVREAFVCATALGVYELFINGKRVGQDVLAPGWTSYHKRLLYQTYEVTNLLRPGENAIGAMLGAGWFKGMMGFILERNNYGNRTALLLQMTVRYEDGTQDILLSDESWLGCNSPVTFSEIYDGERYDARLEQPGWNEPGFVPCPGQARPTPKGKPARDLWARPLTDEEKAAQRRAAQEYRPADIAWRGVETVNDHPQALVAQPSCRVRVNEERPVKEIIVTPKGETVLDFGQNLTGWIRFRVKAKRGETVHIRCFETLDAQGNAYFANLRTAKAELIYTCRGDGEEVWNEHFSFQGFRYAKLEKWPCEVEKERFTALVVHSEMARTGAFCCSNELINRLEENIEWSLRGNFLDIPTDCPQRDERMGWTGDAQIFCRTAAFLRNVDCFYCKWLKDVAADQTEEGGVPHIVPNSLQFHKISDWLLSQGTHSAAAWADVAVIAPWTLYLVYGDRRVLEEQFESMKKWIDFMRDHAQGNIWNYRLQFGDWVALDAQEGSYFGATPNDLTCTAYFAYSTGLFVKACRVLGKKEMAQEYQALYERIARTFRETFMDENGVMKVETQTAHIIALFFGLTPPEGRRGTVEGLKRLIQKENGHLVTGFVGTPYFCHALSQNGATEEAYALLLKEDFPSWLYQVKRGATTVWEHWDGLKPDGTMWSADMNSFNHYAYGAIGDWLYRVVAGIDTDEERPGYKHSVLLARTGGGLDWAKGDFDSVYGRLSSSWQREGARVTRTMTVPVNTTSTIILEENAQDPQSELNFTRGADGLWRAQTGSGEWTVSYRINGQ